MTHIPLNSLFLMLILMAFGTLAASAQEEVPTINPTAVYTDIKGEQEESEKYAGSAPLIGRFTPILTVGF